MKFGESVGPGPRTMTFGSVLQILLASVRLRMRRRLTLLLPNQVKAKIALGTVLQRREFYQL